MKDYKPAMSFDATIAASYDRTQRGDEASTVAFLEALAQGGRTLELAIGTGRIALPLAERGVPIVGIDISPAMVSQLRSKAAGEQIEVRLGNFADVDVPGRFDLIYVVFNTLFNLLTQEEQVRCFVNVADHLENGGRFAVEGVTPGEFYRLRNHQYVDAEAIHIDHVRLDVARFDPVQQLLEESHVTLSSAGIQINPIVTRCALPSELDLMARIAGMRLQERWGGWNREPFTADSRNCISVYAR